MGQTTIEWTATYHHDGAVTPGYTFNPWIGCTKVSPGCHHCYAETLMDKRYGRVKWGPAGIRSKTSDANWRKPVAWNKQAETTGKRFKVFCASLADVFEDNDQIIKWRKELFTLISQTPNLDWLLLTKRPENVNRMAADYAGDCYWIAENLGKDNYQGFSNIWIGTSIENQKTADIRIPELLDIPAKIRFLSIEPLLNQVLLRRWIPPSPEWLDCGIHWIIAGGESGPGARPMHPNWVRQIRDDCTAVGVPFFFKQWGRYLPAEISVPGGTKIHFFNSDGSRVNNMPMSENPGGFMMWDVGKKAAGRLLDGREWNEMPEDSK